MITHLTQQRKCGVFSSNHRWLMISVDEDRTSRNPSISWALSSAITSRSESPSRLLLGDVVIFLLFLNVEAMSRHPKTKAPPHMTNRKTPLFSTVPNSTSFLLVGLFGLSRWKLDFSWSGGIEMIIKGRRKSVWEVVWCHIGTNYKTLRSSQKCIKFVACKVIMPIYKARFLLHLKNF